MFRKLRTLIQRSPQPTSSLRGERLLSAPIDNPEILDLFWADFTNTGTVAAVLRIVSVLDGDDLVRSRLQAWLSEIRPEMWVMSPYKEYQQLLARCSFPIDYDRRSIGGPLDLDLHVSLLARSRELKFAELPIPLSPRELVRLAMKSAACWSLLSMAQQHDAVARVCEQESKKPGGAARLHLGSAQVTLSKRE
jgi:hypothetical protein